MKANKISVKKYSSSRILNLVSPPHRFETLTTYILPINEVNKLVLLAESVVNR